MRQWQHDLRSRFLNNASSAKRHTTLGDYMLHTVQVQPFHRSNADSKQRIPLYSDETVESTNGISFPGWGLAILLANEEHFDK